MKDKIFLIWSGSNTVALKVKKILETEHNYLCYVGGSHENNSQMFSVGDTVVKEMNTCNQSIVLFQNKINGNVSNNLFFELGYVSAKYGMKKVHCVKRKDDAITLPSDFDNSFVEGLEGDDDQYARNIVEYLDYVDKSDIIDKSNFSVIICFVTFMVNDVYILINWCRMRKRQIQEE